jgi:predicted DCC family thiol-disulfide oxidoreductase YuxK
MATATASAEKILIFDGDCPMCRSTVGLLLRSGLVKPEQARANYDLQGPDRELAEAAGLRNELVVLDPQTRETRRGTDGLLWIARDNTGHRFVFSLLSLPGVRHLLRFGYQIVSYNRRVISPPRHQITCDCEPEVTLARRLSLIVPVTISATIVIGMFGAAVFYGAQLGDASDGALRALVATATGFVPLVVAALVLLRGEQRVDYIAHLAVTSLAGGLVLLPAALIAPWLPSQAAVGVAAISAVVSVALMFAMQRRRTRAIRLSHAWLIGWLVMTVAGLVGACWTYLAA